jgi:ABC-type branched-subunit amino acid transport system permease subunit
VLKARSVTAAWRPSPLVVWIEAIWLVAVIVFPFLPLGLGIFFGIDLLVLSILALSLDLCWGVAGIICLGQAAFFGAGAYTVAVLNTKMGTGSGLLLLAAAVAVAAAFAFVLGLFLFSGRRDVGLWYLALATLAVTYASERFVTSTNWLGADSGIPAVIVDFPFVSSWGSTSSYYVLTAVLLIVYAGLRIFLRTETGLVLRAMREDPERISFFGYSLFKLRLGVFTASAALAGLAGGLSAITTGFVSSDLLGLGLSTNALLWLIIGGGGVLVGALIGTAVLEILRLELSTAYPTAWPVAIGCMIVAFVAILPGGLMGLVTRAETRVHPPEPVDADPLAIPRVGSEEST